MSKAAELAALIGSGQAQGNKNLIINGSMICSQRGTSSSGLGSDTSANFIVDRTYTNSSSAGRYTASQNTVTDLPGFANSLKLDCTTADTSIAADEYLLLQHRFEGQNLQQLKKGTSSAESVTISFYVKGNAAATYTAELYDYDNTRTFSQRFNVTTSWNRVSLTYAGDTSGAFDDDNAVSLILMMWLHAGSNYTSGTQNSGWAAYDATTRANSSDTSFFDSTNRTFEITGLQLEIGEVATPFEHEDFGTTLAKCQRYYYRIGGAGTYHRYGVGSCQGTNSCGVVIYPPAGEMRDVPALETTGTDSNYAIYEADAVHACTSIPAINSVGTNSKHFNITFVSSSNLASGNAAEVLANNNADAFLAFQSEL
jgi:hypothetical protein